MYVRTEVPEVYSFPGHWYDLNDLNHVWNQMGYDPIQSQEWFIFPLIFGRPDN